MGHSYIVPGKACPGCGGEVEYELTCRTYPQTRFDGTPIWMSCMPCDSARFWSCALRWEGEGGCDWHFTEDLNPGNPRWEQNEESRPEWLNE